MDVRAYVLRHLAIPAAEARFGPPYLPAAISAVTGCRPQEVWEAAWGLVADGLVYLDTDGQGSSTGNWRWRLSSAGTRSSTEVRGSHATPTDTCAGCAGRCPIWIRWPCATSKRRCGRLTHAATWPRPVMLGVASEQVFNRLAAAFVAASGTHNTGLEKLLDDSTKTYFSRFQEFRKRLEPIRDNLPDGLSDVLTLDAVGDLLRVTRNAAGHPSGQAIDEDTARTHLHMAALYLQEVTAIQRHFVGAVPGSLIGGPRPL